MKLLAEAVMIGTGGMIAGYALYSLHFKILWAWRRRRTRKYRKAAGAGTPTARK